MIDLATTTRKSLRVDEVMELFGVSRRTVYYWVEQRKIATVIIDGITRIDVDALRQKMSSVQPEISPLFSSLSFKRACNLARD